MKKAFLLFLGFLFFASTAFASGQQTLVDTRGNPVGTAANPLFISGGGTASIDIIGIASDADIATQENSIAASDAQITSFNGNQYGCYSNSALKLVLWKRSLSGGDVTKYTYDGTGGRQNIAISGIDYHESCSLGIDPNGYIHVSPGMHNVALIYYRSTSVEDISALTSIGSYTGSNETTVSYVRYFNRPSDGVLFVTYRQGNSGNGDQYLKTYDHSSTTWSNTTGTSSGRLINGTTSIGGHTYNPYPWGSPRFDSNGNFHWASGWRRDDEEQDTNPFYVKWNGTSFLKADGSSQTVPITFSNADTIETVTTSQALASMNSSEVDGNGRPHFSYTRSDANSKGQVFHAYYNGSSWVIKQLSNSLARPWPLNAGRSPLDTQTRFPDRARPEIAVDRTTNVVYVIDRDLSESTGITVYESEPNDFTSWKKYSIYRGEVGYFEPTYDRYQWEQSRIFYIPVITISPQFYDAITAAGANYSVLRWNPSKGRGSALYGRLSNLWSNENMYFTTDGTSTRMVLSPGSGFVDIRSSLSYAGIDNYITMYSSGATVFSRLGHDGTNGILRSTAGGIMLRGTSSTQNLISLNTGHVIVYETDSGTRLAIDVAANATEGIIKGYANNVQTFSINGDTTSPTYFTNTSVCLGATSCSGPLTVNAPAAQTIAATNTITADGCGTIKLITSAGAVTTSTTDTFTAPAATNEGCIMYVCNSGTNNITLDNNANFKSFGGLDVVMTQDDCVTVGSTGASGVWYQLTTLVAN